MSTRSLHVVALASNQPGTGKTTLAINLAVLARAADPNRPVLLIGLDPQNRIDRSFGDGEPGGLSMAGVLRGADLASAVRPGRYGVHFVPTSAAIRGLEAELTHPRQLRERIEQSGFSGLVLLDTPSDLGILTQNAIWASDLTLVPVTDADSLIEAERVFDLLEGFGRAREQARIVLSLVDRRIREHGAEQGDVLAQLLARIRTRGLPLFESFVSRSRRIEALQALERPLPVSEGAPDAPACDQLRHLTDDVLRALAESEEPGAPRFERRARPRLPYRAQLVAFRAGEPRLIQLEACDLSEAGLGASADAQLDPGERLHVALRQASGEPTLVWARSVRGDGFAFEDSAALRLEVARPHAQ